VSGRRAVFRAVGRLTPSTRWYPLRARLLRAQGFDVARSARVTASATFMVGQVVVGEESFIGHRVRAYGGLHSRIVIGDGCDVGPEVCILAGTHIRASARRRAGEGASTTVIVEDGCWIGGRAVLVGPCRIGAGSMVAAGATVRCDVPPNSLFFGPRSNDLRPLET
jgi:maltose O-acetyltransferase